MMSWAALETVLISVFVEERLLIVLREERLRTQGPSTLPSFVPDVVITIVPLSLCNALACVTVTLLLLDLSMLISLFEGSPWNSGTSSSSLSSIEQSYE